MRRRPSRSSRNLRCGTPATVLAVAAVLLAAPGRAAGEEPADFAALRRAHARAAFDAAAKYLEAKPDAPDAVEAYRFLFETALAEDLTREAKAEAERFLAGHPTAGPGDKSLARRVAMTALALDGDSDAAIDVFGEELAAVRRIDPSAAVDAATRVAAAVQRGGNPEAAKAVYGQLQRAFLFNAGVETIVRNRLARLELLGKPLPAIGIADLEGRPGPAGGAAGKVVLVDFWATNCPPCLEELPELRRLHADHHQAGFEVLAVSLDDEEAAVREYLSRTPVPWRVFVSAADGGATRKAFGVELIPANFLVGPDGTVAGVDLHGADLRSEVERLLRAGSPRAESPPEGQER